MHHNARIHTLTHTRPIIIMKMADDDDQSLNKKEISEIAEHPTIIRETNF